jgi:prepilin-type N-terminal cleavage/methylation domain-containing protein
MYCFLFASRQKDILSSEHCYNDRRRTDIRPIVSFHFFPSLSMSSAQTRRGFTLIELLLVIGIIAILASIVIVAINPTKQLGDARNAQRRSDVNTILNAVYQYAIDNNGTTPSDITTTRKEICVTGAASCVGGADLDALTGSYLVRIPTDPQSATATGAGYWIVEDANGRITVDAPTAENQETISVTR